MSYLCLSLSHTHTHTHTHHYLSTPTHSAWFRSATHRRTHSGRPDKAETTQTRIRCPHPSCRCVLGSKVRRWEAGKAGAMDEGFSLLLHTHECAHTHSPAPTHTSMLVAVGRCGRRDPTRANMTGRQTQEARPGGQDVSEIHFLRRPA